MACARTHAGMRIRAEPFISGQTMTHIACGDQGAKVPSRAGLRVAWAEAGKANSAYAQIVSNPQVIAVADCQKPWYRRRKLSRSSLVMISGYFSRAQWVPPPSHWFHWHRCFCVVPLCMPSGVLCFRTCRAVLHNLRGCLSCGTAGSQGPGAVIHGRQARITSGQQ